MTATEQRAEVPAYPPGWLVGQLPVGMRDDDLLVRFTTIFERLGATLRAGADGIEHLADPTVTTPGMLHAMGRWLGADVIDEDLPTAHQRRIVAALGQALPWRGTARGLRLVLEAITDGPVTIRDPGRVVAADQGTIGDEDGVVVVEVLRAGHLRPHELRAFVRDEVPAHLGVEVRIAGEAGGGDDGGERDDVVPGRGGDDGGERDDVVPGRGGDEGGDVHDDPDGDVHDDRGPETP